MKAQVGDWLVVEGPKAEDHRKIGRITEVKSPDGSPPYRVHWRGDEQETLVVPGPDARVASNLEDEGLLPH